MPPADRVCKTSVDLLAALQDSVDDFTEAMARAPVEGRGALVGELARSICDLTQQLNIAIGAERRSDRVTSDRAVGLMCQFVDEARAIITNPGADQPQVVENFKDYTNNVKTRANSLNELLRRSSRIDEELTGILPQPGAREP